MKLKKLNVSRTYVNVQKFQELVCIDIEPLLFIKKIYIILKCFRIKIRNQINKNKHIQLKHS